MVTSGANDVARSADSLPFDAQELLTPAAFPHPVTRLEMRQTNISYVILTGPFAYKIKKSVKLEFIDTSTLALRRHLCEEELRLNRRLAADLYLDVVSITRDAAGLRVGGNGEIIDYAVRMKQFEASQELSELLEHGAGNPGRNSSVSQRVWRDFMTMRPRRLPTRIILIQGICATRCSAIWPFCNRTSAPI